MNGVQSKALDIRLLFHVAAQGQASGVRRAFFFTRLVGGETARNEMQSCRRNRRSYAQRVWPISIPDAPEGELRTRKERNVLYAFRLLPLKVVARRWRQLRYQLCKFLFMSCSLVLVIKVLPSAHESGSRASMVTIWAANHF